MKAIHVFYRMMLLLLIAGLAACGEDGVSSDTGSVEAFVQDSPQSSSPKPTGAQSFQASSFSGTIQGNFKASISTDGSTWVDLGSPNGISVQLQNTGSGTSVHGKTHVPVGTYSRVRLTVQDAKISLAQGSIIGGINLDGVVELSLGASSEVVIEKQISSFTVDSDTEAQIAFELNSEQWVTEEKVQQQSSVTTAEVRSSTTATARVQ